MVSTFEKPKSKGSKDFTNRDEKNRSGLKLKGSKDFTNPDEKKKETEEEYSYKPDEDNPDKEKNSSDEDQDEEDENNQIRFIGPKLTRQQKEKLKDLPPCPFESDPKTDTLSCLDLACWDSNKYRHRRARPQTCWYGKTCRSFLCFRLHPVSEWKKNLIEVKRKAEIRYRTKQEESQEAWGGYYDCD